MKTNSIIYLLAIVLLSLSCGEKSENAYEESIEAQNEMSGTTHDSDTNIVKRDGTLLDEMANVLSDGSEVSAAADQYFSPTLVGDVVDANGGTPNCRWDKANGGCR